MTIQMTKPLVGTALFAGALALLSGSFAYAADQGSVARGGRLYDKWYAETGQEAPKESHKLYPAEGKYADKAGSNWRCKECHGWDGNGADGAYSAGKHFTGIKGINGMQNGDPAAVIAVLTGAGHGFGDYLSEADLGDLANFVVHGEYGYSAYVSDGKITGDAERGGQVYRTICANCHGAEGKLPKEMPPLASLVGNPWEVMHKVLNGQPHEVMPGLRALDHQISADVIAYIAAELPPE
ncbi:MAG: c-type cytochrome [Roseovarius sp.]|nr:c-type cytochrome [Roseovarius sp.]